MKVAPIALALAIASVSVAQAQQITGAGSSFAAPIYGKWAEAAKPSTGVSLNYQAIGSGGGQNQIFNRTVDFGASDAPVPHDKLASENLLQFPTVMGGVAMIVNIPGIATDKLKLTGDLVADIYLGKITKWNDAKITEINAGLTLPNLAIAPVYRADGSGTTFVFTDYLSLVSPDWKSKVGSATSVKWPAGTGSKGSDGVAGSVRNIRGGIGYVESAYADQNKLTTTLLKNKAGQFVAPSMEAFTAAAENADWSKAQDFAINLNDQPGDKSWPIVSATFVLLPTNPKDPAQSKAVISFFDWSFTNGDPIAKDLEYVPLPKSVKAEVRKAWSAQIKGPDGKPVF
jgi:phosphate transport system substrate-binding protein